MKMQLLSPLVWVGGKKSGIPKLWKYFPLTMEIYVEPFMGGGSVGLKLLQEQRIKTKAVFNDLNADLIKFWNDCKNNQILSYYPNILTMTLEQAKTLYQNIINNGCQKGWELLYLNRCSWFGIIGCGSRFNNQRWNNTYDSYLNRVKLCQQLLNSISTIIVNDDYQAIIKHYDSIETWFYFDPPYYNVSKNIYQYETIDYLNLATILKTIKGKFILSLNNKPYIKQLFKDFYIYEEQWIHCMRSFNHKKDDFVNELVITNFKVNC